MRPWPSRREPREQKSDVIISDNGFTFDYFFKPVTVALQGISFRKKAKMTETEKKMIIGKIKDGIERYYEIMEPWFKRHQQARVYVGHYRCIL